MRIIRLRHNTTKSRTISILKNNIIRAGEKNRVYVEIAKPRSTFGKVRGSARDKERELLLPRGRANAGIDFDADIDEIYSRVNSLTGREELYLVGDVNLRERNPEIFERS